MKKYDQTNLGWDIIIFGALHIAGLSYFAGYAVYTAYDCTRELFKRQEELYKLPKEQQQHKGNNLEKIIELK